MNFAHKQRTSLQVALGENCHCSKFIVQFLMVTFRSVKLNFLAMAGDFRKAIILTTQFKPCIMLLVTNKAIGQLVNKLDFC